MYSEITIKSSLKGLKAYEFDCSDPKYIMCCVHGIGEYFLRYERVAGILGNYGIKMIGMDLRGHGATAGKPGHCAPRTGVLSDIDGMLEYAMTNYPQKPIILYGHSMGGNIALDYRYRGRLNGVPAAYVISAPWIKLVRPVTGALYHVVNLMSKIAPSLTIGSDIDETILGNPKLVTGYSNDPMTHNKISLQTAIEGFTIGNALYDGSWEQKGKGCSKPLLLMHGDEDKICDVNGSRQLAQNEGDICTYIEWKNHYHEIHNGGPDSTGEEVINKIGQWITETVK